MTPAAKRAAVQGMVEHRLGFSYEGTFRQATVVKGRNRDTARFSIIDGEWPALQSVIEDWLDPGNFTPDGRQRSALADRTAAKPSTTKIDAGSPRNAADSDDVRYGCSARNAKSGLVVVAAMSITS